MSQTEVKRPYKATFILNTRGVDSEIDAIIGELKEVITSLGGEVKREENLGRKEFIRVTDRNHTGDFYLQFDVDGPAGLNKSLQDKLRLERKVKRVFVENR